jgi:hypothetical protein
VTQFSLGRTRGVNAEQQYPVQIFASVTPDEKALATRMSAQDTLTDKIVCISHCNTIVGRTAKPNACTELRRRDRAELGWIRLCSAKGSLEQRHQGVFRHERVRLA